MAAGGLGGLVYLVMTSAQQKKGHTTYENTVMCLWPCLTGPKV